MLNSIDTLKNFKAGQKLTNHAKNAVIKSDWLAKKFKYDEILEIHLFYAIFLEKGSLGSNILSDLGLKKDLFQKVLLENSPGSSIPQGLPSEGLKKIFTKAFSVAKDLNYPYVGTEHLIYALMDSDDKLIKKILGESEIKSSETLKSFFDPGQLPGISKLFNIPEISLSKSKSSPTPYLDKFCSDLNKEAKNKKEVVIGREKELERIINILGRKNKNNPILVGEPGVGKTALISGLANLINSGDVPNSLYGKKIMNLDLAHLIAGTSFRGEFESRLKEIVNEVISGKNIILFIDEIHNIVGAGNIAGSLDLANIIKPALSKGEFQLIGATTFAEYKRSIEKDAALERRFQPVAVSEPSVLEAKKILSGIKSHYESFHNVTISDSAVDLAVELSVKYINGRFLPDKAIDVIDEAASNVRSKNKISDFLKEIRKNENEKTKLLEQKESLVSSEKFEEAISLRKREKELEEKINTLRKMQSASEKEKRIQIEDRDIFETVSKISGIPVEKLARTKTKKILNIKKIIGSKLIGQPEVIEKLSNTLLRSHSGISNPDRPLGSFLFLGPTGVGKTLTAKILAEEFFGREKSLVRIDMSELMERHSIASLIGSPAGYVGYGEGGNLTEKIRRNPYSVVLFDEIEKAHPEARNILLQIIEDGILTDAQGLQVSFKNSIIIMTSNIGTDEFTNAAKVGFGSDIEPNQHEDFNQTKERALRELRWKIKPELLNRMDGILIFNALTKKDLEKIAKLELKKLRDKIKKQGMDLVMPAKMESYIAERSFDFNQGARLVRKNIQETIENKIAELLVFEKVNKGKITASLKNGEIKII